MKFRRKGIFTVTIIQIAIAYLSLSGVIAKKMSICDPNSTMFILYGATIIFILATYAIVWQQIIKHVDISVAYANKGSSLAWVFFWSYLIFGETITPNNIIGALIVVVGVLVVTYNAG